jgi:hypothetical protein
MVLVYFISNKNLKKMHSIFSIKWVVRDKKVLSDGSKMDNLQKYTILHQVNTVLNMIHSNCTGECTMFWQMSKMDLLNVSPEYIVALQTDYGEVFYEKENT